MNESRVCLLCLIGLPAAGKTTLANCILKSKLCFTHVEHICYDELIKWEDENILWKDKRKYIYKIVEEKIKAYIAEHESSHTLLLILDDNMYYRSMRYEFYQLARKLKTKFCQVFLDTPVQICLERNSLRTLPLPTHHILNINEKLECPSPNNFWEVDSLILKYTVNLDESLNLIKSLLTLSKIPVELQEEERDRSQSVKHTADIALRKIVSLLIKEIKMTGANNVSQKVSGAIKRRKEILEIIENGDLHLPDEQNVNIYVQYLIPLFQFGSEE